LAEITGVLISAGTLSWYGEYNVMPTEQMGLRNGFAKRANLLFLTGNTNLPCPYQIH
jgi:hypothetical protein